MLSDGLTAAQADGTAREEVKVLDIAQMLLEAVKRSRGAAPVVTNSDNATDTDTKAAEQTGEKAKAQPEPATETSDPAAVGKTRPEVAAEVAEEAGTPAGGGVATDTEPYEASESGVETGDQSDAPGGEGRTRPGPLV
jgi:hypothetical protein